jgi:hypothetical protein
MSEQPNDRVPQSPREHALEADALIMMESDAMLVVEARELERLIAAHPDNPCPIARTFLAMVKAEQARRANRPPYPLVY